MPSSGSRTCPNRLLRSVRSARTTEQMPCDNMSHDSGPNTVLRIPVGGDRVQAALRVGARSALAGVTSHQPML